VNFGNIATKKGRILVLGKNSENFPPRLEKFRTNMKNINKM
jgi:hypothetical protein